MSATSRAFRGVHDAEIVETSREAEQAGGIRQLVATRGIAGTIARLVLGGVMFPHAAQKVLGWFGGYGYAGTHEFFTAKVGLPGWLATAAIITEFAASLMLLFGVLSRIAALGIIGIMVGAIYTTHWPNGFFMNWTGTKAGEGFEYHLLAIALGLVVVIVGGGLVSVDRELGRPHVRRVERRVVEPVTLD